MGDTRPRIVLVAALARGGVIGRDGGMPWHLPADLAHFKSVTLGYPVIMGRKTFASIGKALPGRRNVVVSRSGLSFPPDVVRVESFAGAVKAVEDAGQLMIIGGGQIYTEALDLADCLELTLIDASIEGDTHFPPFRSEDWQVESLRSRPPDQRNRYPLRFVRLRRAGK